MYSYHIKIKRELPWINMSIPKVILYPILSTRIAVVKRLTPLQTDPIVPVNSMILSGIDVPSPMMAYWLVINYPDRMVIAVIMSATIKVLLFNPESNSL